MTPSATPDQQIIPKQISPQQAEYIHRAAWKAGVLGALNMAARILAGRAIVMIAVVGGIFLAYPALSQPDWFRVGILGVYCLGVVLPAVVLAALLGR